MVGANTPLSPMEVRRNRRARGAAAGGEPGGDDRARGGETGVAPAVGAGPLQDAGQQVSVDVQRHVGRSNLVGFIDPS